MRKLDTEKALLLALAIVLAVMAACLLSLRAELRQVETELEAFKQETYDRERSLLAAQAEAVPAPVKTAAEEVVFEIPDLSLEGTETGTDSTPSSYRTDTDYVLRVLTAEAGNDPLLCGCVAQCMLNAYRRGDYVSVEEMLYDYGYASPAGWISEAAGRAWDDVFCSCVRYPLVGDAEFFYAPSYCSSEWHESMRFVAEIGGVRFFGRWD